MTLPIDDYRAFVAASPPSPDGYLFDTPRCRFWPEPSDELVAAPGVTAVGTPAGPAVELPGGAMVPVSALDLQTLKRVLELLPCRYARVALELGPRSDAFMEQAFSRFLFAPAAVAELELVQPACEIVRFPGSPYEVVRAYWRNACAVRARLEQVAEPPPTIEALRSLLQELHRLLLLGAPELARRSFYLPASSLARKRVTPGEFYEAETQTERRGSEVLITSGARVSVPQLGGATYWQLLAESVDDLGALDSERPLSLAGVELGRVVQARAASERESDTRPWFLPPRPLTSEHFAALLSDLRAAWLAREQHQTEELLRALASFHYRFVRTHPLPSGNQSLAMSVVNLLLRPVLGIGMPHLLLDQFALRFQLAAYQRLFARAARAWCAPWPSATERLRNLLRMRAELNAFVVEIGAQSSLVAARALLASGAHGAELALLTEPGDVRRGIG